MVKLCKTCNSEFSVTSPGARYCAPCKEKCAVPDCHSKPRERGYCAKHHSRLLRKGSVGPAESHIASMNGQCMIVGCEGNVVSNSLCNMHYRRLLRTGELGPVERKRARVGSGVDRKGYRVLRVAGKEYKEHRLVMERILGRPLRASENVHHLDGDRLNNDPSNLELWAKTQPCGQRVENKVEAAIRLLKEYPEIVGRKGFCLTPLESQEATDMLSSDFYLFVGADAPAVI